MNKLGDAPRIDPHSPTCVRFDGKRYELVVDGKVEATITTFAWQFTGRRQKFLMAVQKHRRAQEIDHAVDRLFRDDDHAAV